MTAMCWDVGCQQQQLAMAITATCMLNGVHHNALRVFIRFSNEFSNSASEGFYSVRLMHASCVSAHTTAHIPKYVQMPIYMVALLLCKAYLHFAQCIRVC
jgi:hypothetical protein